MSISPEVPPPVEDIKPAKPPPTKLEQGCGCIVLLALLVIAVAVYNDNTDSGRTASEHNTRAPCAYQIMARAREEVGDENVTSVDVSGGGHQIVVSYTRSVGLMVRWMKVELMLEAMDLMEFAFTAPGCTELMSLGLISYTDTTDRFGNEQEVKASEMWLDRDTANRINWSVISRDRHRFEALLRDYGKLWLHRSLRGL